MTTTRAFTLAGLVSLTAFAAACSGGGATGSVAGPSTSSSTSTGSGATITGTVATALRAQSFQTLGTGTGLTVSLTGTNVSSPVDASGSFTLNGVPSGDDDLHITGGGNDAHVHVSSVGSHEHISVTLTVTGSTATVEDSDRESDDGNDVEVEGLVTAIDPTAHTLTVRDKVITVPDGIPITHGALTIKFTDIQVGNRVHVHGTKSASGITATRIMVQDAASTEVDHD